MFPEQDEFLELSFCVNNYAYLRAVKKQLTIPDPEDKLQEISKICPGLAKLFYKLLKFLTNSLDGKILKDF